MGCDVHEKRFLKVKGKPEYIDVSYRYHWEYEEEGDKIKPIVKLMPEIIGERYYDFFGVLGNSSRSSSFDAMDDLESGVPDFLSKQLEEYTECPDYYGFCYITHKKLKRGLIKYRNNLEKKINKGNTRENTHGYNKYTGRYIHDELSIVHYIDELIEKMNSLETEEFKIKCDLLGVQNVDIENMIYVFFFDN